MAGRQVISVITALRNPNKNITISPAHEKVVFF
jgi:hypothetical protein